MPGHLGFRRDATTPVEQGQGLIDVVDENIPDDPEDGRGLKIEPIIDEIGVLDIILGVLGTPGHSGAFPAASLTPGGCSWRAMSSSAL